MGEAKKWYVTSCAIHGDKPKGQPYREIKVAAPPRGSKMLGRHRTACPICAMEQQRENK